MHHQQVGDASVLAEGQTEGGFGLSGSISVAVDVAVDPVDVAVHSVDPVDLAIHAVDSVGDPVLCKHRQYEGHFSTGA